MRLCAAVPFASAIWFDTAGMRVRGSWLRNDFAKSYRRKRALDRTLRAWSRYKYYEDLAHVLKILFLSNIEGEQ